MPGCLKNDDVETLVPDRVQGCEQSWSCTGTTGHKAQARACCSGVQHV